MPEKKKTNETYENNPFTIALQGINLLFNKARGVAILLLVVSVISVMSNGSRDIDKGDDKGMDMPSWSPEQWAMFGAIFAIVILALLFIGSMISGISAYTSAQLAKGNTVSLKEAFNAVLERFFSYIWLQIITTVKILLWTLLLIVPGIIMAFRYSLANVAFFDKELRGNAAIKESLQLTKGAWLTTFASQTLFSIITLGIIGELVTAGARAVLYRQLSTIKEGAKPEAHILSWLTLFIPFGLLMLALFALGVLAIAFNAGDYSK